VRRKRDPLAPLHWLVTRRMLAWAPSAGAVTPPSREAWRLRRAGAPIAPLG
jgi:hypothetical protein